MENTGKENKKIENKDIKDTKNTEIEEKSESKNENKKVSFDTMVNVGIKKEIAKREYIILPVNIEDMGMVISDNPNNRLIIISRKQVEESDNDLGWQTFGLNLIDENRKRMFMKVVNKYLYYKGEPMTEERLIEHGWSFKDVGEFLLTWCEASD